MARTHVKTYLSMGVFLAILLLPGPLSEDKKKPDPNAAYWDRVEKVLNLTCAFNWHLCADD